jgi:hypothetical protein
LLSHHGQRPFEGSLISLTSLDIVAGTSAKESDKCHGKIYDFQSIAAFVP